MAGLTDTGWLSLTRAEILEAYEAYERAKISDKLDLGPDQVLGSVNAISADHHEQLWQLAEEAYAAFDLTNATDDRVVALGVTMGVPRRGATQGLVTTTCQFSAGGSYAAGALVAQVAGEPDNLWSNRFAVTVPSSGFFPVKFISTTAGAAAIAPAGTLTIIPTPVAGWVSITNAADAQPGLDIEPIDALRVRISQSTARGGLRTTGAVRAAVVSLPGVLSCDVYENVLAITANGIPPHSMRVVVWDGVGQAADDDEIAQAIWDHSATFSMGQQTGEAVDEELGVQVVQFDRATASAVTIAVNIQSASRVAASAVRAALVAAMPNIVGRELTFNRISSAVFAVAGVDDWVTFTVNGGTADLPAAPTTIYTLSTSNITVTGDVT